MKNNYAIINYEYEPTYSFKDLSNVYEIRQKGAISRFVVKLLVRLKLIQQYQERITTFAPRHVSVNTESIIHDLCEKINMGRYMMNNEIAGIMVGREHFRLIRDDYVKSSRTVYGNIAYADMNTRKIMDVPIVLNPFIDGIVFCTKDMLKDMDTV